MPDTLDWSLVRSEAGPDLGLVRTRFDWMRHPGGDPVLKRLVIESCDWVNCVATTADGRVVLVEQYRFGSGTLTLEPPGGSVDPGESPREAVQRELLEETGFGGGTWTDLGFVQPNPAILSNRCHHFRAEGVQRIAEPTPGEGEVIRVHEISLDEVRAAVADGRIRHALALSALTRVFDVFGVGGSI